MAPHIKRTPWTKDQRLVLDILWKTIKAGPLRIQVFNHLFADYHKAHGRPNGHSLGTISSQYFEHRKARARALWVGILFEPFTTEDRTRRQVWQTNIDNACIQLQVQAQVPQASRSLRTKPAGVETINPNQLLLTDTVTASTISRVDQETGQDNEVDSHYEHSALALLPTLPYHIDPMLEPQASDEPAFPLSDIQQDIISAGLQTSDSPPYSSATVEAAEQLTSYDMHTLKRANGPDLTLSKIDYDAAMAPLHVTDDEIHLKPVPAVLYRLWSASSNGQNSSQGFQAALFKRSNVFDSTTPILAPPSLCWTSVFLHLNQEEIASSFISCSSSFTWVMRAGLRAALAGVRGLHISLMNTEKLNSDNVFHAAPFYRELKRKKAFTDGIWLNHGTHEFLVYGRVSADT